MSIPLPTGWKRRSAEGLVELVLETNVRFKFVGAELDTRPPSEAAAKRLIDAYEAGDAPPWLTAYLLGCVGHEVGYGTVRAILLAAPRMLAESYAGPALAKIRGSGAHDDLVHLTMESPARRSREGAAYGLAHLGTGEAATAIINAAVSGAIGYQLGGVLIDLPVGAERIAELLDAEERGRRVAIEYLTGLIQRAAGQGLGSPEAAERLAANRGYWLAAVQRLFADEDFRMAPRQRASLTQWVSE
ncbi:MAG: hypothetical protein ACFCGT_11175 [Sandaracinaceae bacterium]